MRYRDYCNITFEQIELMKRTISFNGTRLRGWKYKSFQIHQNCICRDESNVVALQELLYDDSKRHPTVFINRGWDPVVELGN